MSVRPSAGAGIGAAEGRVFGGGGFLRGGSVGEVMGGGQQLAVGPRGGLNIYKWDKQGLLQVPPNGGWRTGDAMLYLKGQGSPAANWAQNAGRLRSEMGYGRPIFDAFRDPVTGAQKVTGGFLRAERYLLESRGWKYNPSSGAYHPPVE